MRRHSAVVDSAAPRSGVPHDTLIDRLSDCGGIPAEVLGYQYGTAVIDAGSRSLHAHMASCGRSEGIAQANAPTNSIVGARRKGAVCTFSFDGRPSSHSARLTPWLELGSSSCLDTPTTAAASTDDVDVRESAREGRAADD